MFKANNKNTRTKSLTSFWCFYCYYELISHLFLVFLLLTWKKLMLAWRSLIRGKKERYLQSLVQQLLVNIFVENPILDFWLCSEYDSEKGAYPYCLYLTGHCRGGTWIFSGQGRFLGIRALYKHFIYNTQKSPGVSSSRYS